MAFDAENLYNQNLTDQLLVGKQRFDAAKQGALLVNGVSALFRNINKVQDTTSQVCQCNNSLHFNGVALFQGMIENSWSVNDLPTKVLVIAVSYK